MPRDEADALRRRLYAPDASTEDVARYQAVATASVPVVPEAAATEQAVAEEDAPVRPAAPPRPRRRRGVVVGAVAAAVVVAAIGVAATRSGGIERPDGVRAPATASADRTDREAFEQNLEIGNKAGIAAYLVTHRSPKALEGATRFFTIERAGVGRAEIDLAPVPVDAIRGRATVLLVVGSDATADWTAYRRRVDATGEQQWARQAARGGEQAAGVLTSATFRYALGDRPVRLLVDVDDGVRWGVAVVFSD